MAIALYLIGAILALMLITVVDEDIDGWRDYQWFHVGFVVLWPLGTLWFGASFLWMLARGKL